MNIQTRVLEACLREAGLRKKYREEMLGGGLHQRWTLQASNGTFVAWFCRYERPANPARNRPAMRGTTSIKPHRGISEAQAELARQWLLALEAQHQA